MLSRLVSASSQSTNLIGRGLYGEPLRVAAERAGGRVANSRPTRPVLGNLRRSPKLASIAAYGRLLDTRSVEQPAELEHVNLIKPEQIDALMPFVAKFEEAGFSAGTWETEEGHFPWFSFDEVVVEFIQALYDNGWATTEFDWTGWQESAEEFVNSPQRIEECDATTIQKLLTTHSRKDRFCEGHLAAMFENGHIVALLRRLEAIKDASRQRSQSGPITG